MSLRPSSGVRSPPPTRLEVLPKNHQVLLGGGSWRGISPPSPSSPSPPHRPCMHLSLGPGSGSDAGGGLGAGLLLAAPQSSAFVLEAHAHLLRHVHQRTGHRQACRSHTHRHVNNTGYDVTHVINTGYDVKHVINTGYDVTHVINTGHDLAPCGWGRRGTLTRLSWGGDAPGASG